MNLYINDGPWLERKREMVEPLAITLREGIEAALVVGIIFAHLRQIGRSSLRGYVYWGLGMAVVFSIVAAAALKSVGFDPDNELLEGALFGIGGIFVATMVLWMWRAAKNLHRNMESRLDSIVSGEKNVRRTGIGPMTFTFFMVAREGIEMVLILAAATLGQPSFPDFVGGMLGLTLAVLFAILLICGSVRINLKLFFSIATLVLLVLAAKLLSGSVHAFAEVGVIPLSAGTIEVIGYFVEGKASLLLLIVPVALPVLVVLWNFHPSADAQSAAGARKLRQAP